MASFHHDHYMDYEFCLLASFRPTFKFPDLADVSETMIIHDEIDLVSDFETLSLRPWHEIGLCPRTNARYSLRSATILLQVGYST